MTPVPIPAPESDYPSAPIELHALPAFHQLSAPAAYMARNSRSFRFASALLRANERDRVTRVYAWCRFTDDLVDDALVGTTGGSAAAEQRLDAWLACSRAAYDGRTSGVSLVDMVMGEMAERGIPFLYAADLVAGVRSDLRFTQFQSEQELRVYSYRVAGVVGRWLTELHGVREPWMLERATALGHAMQLTNILRDVGEDWDEGRVYIPRSILASYGFAPADIGAMRRGERRVNGAYRGLVEELMAIASRDYDAAREAIPYLPDGFRRSVAVAAAVYEGIHDVIRRNDHDNVRRRAVTTMGRKLILALGALNPWPVHRHGRLGGSRGRHAGCSVATLR